jgi:hypothetical protein
MPVLFRKLPPPPVSLKNKAPSHQINMPVSACEDALSAAPEAGTRFA